MRFYNFVKCLEKNVACNKHKLNCPHSKLCSVELTLFIANAYVGYSIRTLS